MKIIADDKIPYFKGVFEPFAEVLYLPGSRITPADLADADILVTRTRTTCDRALLGNSKVRLVTTATIGIDHLNTAELDELGIQWSNAPGCNAVSVKNYISSALAVLAQDLAGKTLGIIGVGHVGKHICEVGKAFGMNVLLNDPPRAEVEGNEGFTELDELLANSDIVTMHVPLERGGKYPTADLADEKFFAQMKPGAYFFNSCRGEVMDKKAFIDAKKSGHISGALIDVWPGEPDLDPELVTLVDIGTPHIAGYSKDGKANGTTACVRKIAEVFDIPSLRNFCVKSLPEPIYSKMIELDPALADWQQINQAILHAYDIRKDADALRAAPEQFEQIRGSYWNRREFSAYTVSGGSEKVNKSLAMLGFNIG